jgi:beta-glucanase (GH16 family)
MNGKLNGILIVLCLAWSVFANSQTFNLIWSDEFTGNNVLPDATQWNNEVGVIRNGELQYYTDRDIDNQVVKDGNLLIIGKKETFGGQNYTSASLKTKSGWKYGRIEANIKMQTGMGIWGCFWTLGKNMSWPSCGEIDIIEHINSEAMYHTTAHWWNESLTTSNKHQVDGGDAPTPIGSYDANNYNKYGLEWTPSSLKWLLNDVVVKTMSILNGTRGTWEFHAPHGILLNCPIGGSWPQSQPGWDATKIPTIDTMFVDYVRVYSYSSGAPVAPTSLTSSSVTQTSFTVNWSASSGATAYDVVLDNNGITTAYGPFSATTCNITGLTAGTNYSVRVKASNISTNSSDLSELSNPLFVTTTSISPPTPIVNLQLNENSGTTTLNTGVIGGSLNLKNTTAWTTNTPANNSTRTSSISIVYNADAVETSYLVDRLKGLNDLTITGWLNCTDATETGGNRIVNCLGGQWFDATRGTGGFDLAYKTDGSLQFGVNEAIATSSPRSSAGKITTDAAAGTDNWKFFAVNYSATSQSVSFYFGSTAFGATLDKTVTYNKGVVGNDMEPLAIGNFNSMTRGWLKGRMFRGLIDQIQIYNSSLNLAQIIAVQNIAATALNDQKIDVQKLNIYPSPANDNLTVSLGLLNEHDNVNVSVLNLNGSLLYQRTRIDNSTFTIPLNNYANGIYFIKVQTNKETLIQKFIVTK